MNFVGQGSPDGWRNIPITLIDPAKGVLSAIAWLRQLSANNQRRGRFCQLLQLRVLCFGFFQDGDVGVGFFPEVEEVFVGGERPHASSVGVCTL